MQRIFIGITVLLIFGVGISSCKKRGCTDPMSLSFDSDAKKDDGSCTYPFPVKKALFLNQLAPGVAIVAIGGAGMLTVCN
ncbi:MAG: hypothetical protein CM15mP65_16980 [Crocinitomicaceae bacterium]|nr:MAG: hypothetical protein CM15mP65_16980 [Crocinitomicaceae bacterium]